MRILFATTAGAGHFGPLIPFARAAVAAGHEVSVAAPQMFEASVRDAGFEFQPFGERSEAERDALIGRLRAASFDDANAIMLRDGYAGIYARSALPAMIELVERWRPALIVRETLEFASLVAAERNPIPHVQVALGLHSTDRLLRPHAAEPIRALFTEAGVAPSKVESAMDEPILTLTPPSLEEPEDQGTAEAFRSDAPPRPAADGNLPLVFVTLGSEAAAQGYFPDFYRALIGVLASTGVEIIVAIGRAADPAVLGPLPPGVSVERWVDQADVLSRASAAVFHGGYGTMIGALAGGTPLVGMPLFSIDQLMNARRIADVGAGLALDGPNDIASLPAALRRVLDEPGFVDRAGRFSTEIAGLPPPSAAVARLEELAS
jgi:UDP:flavonoid glycosyltransferase YjiC (YdhE family)